MRSSSALDAAVLAPAAVQRVEHDIRLRRQPSSSAPTVAGRRRSSSPRSRPRPARRRPPGRRPARPRARPTSPPISTATRLVTCVPAHGVRSRRGTPMRWISQSSSTPVVSRTRRRTSSPSASRSAAVALPVLIRKLQCFSETWRRRGVRPRQPARSISCQALAPCAGFGLVKVQPPVRAADRLACLARRAGSSPCAAGSPRLVGARRRSSRSTKIQSAGHAEWR